MFLYISDWVGTGTPLDEYRPRAGDAIEAVGGLWSCFDLRTDCTVAVGRALVGSSVQLVAPPAGVTFLVDTVSGLDTAVQNAVRNAINTQLGITVPTGLTWRQLFRRLAKVDGAGRWGTVIGDLLHFGSLGSLDVT